MAIITRYWSTHLPRGGSLFTELADWLIPMMTQESAFRTVKPFKVKRLRTCRPNDPADDWIISKTIMSGLHTQKI